MTSGDVTMRSGRPADAESISALVVALSDSFYTEPDRAGAEAYLEKVSPDAERRYLAAGNFRFLVLERDGRIVGLVAVRDAKHLFHLFVAQEMQGRGWARKLWDAARTAAIAAGNPGAFTVNASLNAVPLYEHFGFVADGEIRRVNGIAYRPMRLDQRTDAARS